MVIEKKEIVREAMSYVISMAAAILIASVINSEVLAKVEVQQSSMEDTLYSGQQLIVDKLSYNFIEPQRGDIIIFLENQGKETIFDDAVIFMKDIKSIFHGIGLNSRLVKRVIGIPGDRVDIKNGYVYINDKKLDEPYAKGKTSSEELKFPIVVPDNKLFVLGDNRSVSRDSREFGFVDYKQVEGKAIFRIFPFNKIGVIK